MAVELTIFPKYLLLSQALQTGSQETDYNLWLLEMPQFWQSQFGVPTLLQPHWLPLVMRAVPGNAGTCPSPWIPCAPTRGSVHSWLPRESLGRSDRTLHRRTAQILAERSLKEGGGSYAKLWLDRPQKRKNINPRPLSGDLDDWATVETLLFAKKIFPTP